jgi:CRP-like cAMP-binding protein
VLLIAHGKVERLGEGRYGDENVLEVLADGDHFGAHAVLESADRWDSTLRAATDCIVLSLSQTDFEQLLERYESLGVCSVVTTPERRSVGRGRTGSN